MKLQVLDSDNARNKYEFYLLGTVYFKINRNSII